MLIPSQYNIQHVRTETVKYDYLSEYIEESESWKARVEGKPRGVEEVSYIWARCSLGASSVAGHVASSVPSRSESFLNEDPLPLFPPYFHPRVGSFYSRPLSSGLIKRSGEKDQLGVVMVGLFQFSKSWCQLKWHLQYNYLPIEGLVSELLRRSAIYTSPLLLLLLFLIKLGLDAAKGFPGCLYLQILSSLE